MDTEKPEIELPAQYSFIAVNGTDAAAFLQSQLSADIAAIETGKATLTGWHDPKGRVLCCLTVVRTDSGFRLILPATMATMTLQGLSRYILRSKVVLTDATGRHCKDSRDRADPERELAAIRAGIPEVYPATRGMFTGQMLNLDLIGGISFSKGCYPGQEVIARTHHLGRAKRRMQRYISPDAPREPAEALMAADGRRAGQVVRSAAATDGSESLVVTTVAERPVLTASDGASLTPVGLPYELEPD